MRARASSPSPPAGTGRKARRGHGVATKTYEAGALPPWKWETTTTTYDIPSLNPSPRPLHVPVIWGALISVGHPLSLP